MRAMNAGRRVRSSWPELPRCCVDGVDLDSAPELHHAEQTAGQHALTNRLDLMNSRAIVVDAWRQIAVYANALLGVFNVQYNGSAILNLRWRRQRSDPRADPEYATAADTHFATEQLPRRSDRLPAATASAARGRGPCRAGGGTRVDQSAATRGAVPDSAAATRALLT